MTSQVDLDVTCEYNLQDSVQRIFPYLHIFHFNFTSSGVTRSLTYRLRRYRKSLHTEQLYNL